MKALFTTVVFSLASFNFAYAASISNPDKTSYTSNGPQVFWQSVSNIEDHIANKKYQKANKLIKRTGKLVKTSHYNSDSFSSVLTSLRCEVNRLQNLSGCNNHNVLKKWPDYTDKSFDKYKALAHLNATQLGGDRSFNDIASAYTLTSSLQSDDWIRRRAEAGAIDKCFSNKALAPWEKAKFDQTLSAVCSEVKLDVPLSITKSAALFIRRQKDFLPDNGYVVADFTKAVNSDGETSIDIDVIEAWPFGNFAKHASNEVNSQSSLSNSILSALDQKNEVRVYFQFEFTNLNDSFIVNGASPEN